MKTTYLNLLALALVAGFATSGASAAVTIDRVTVGHAGNANDFTGYGAVGYEYQIARNETTIYTSWFDAARFCNWLHNGQGNGSTETGAYTLEGVMDGIVQKNADARFCKLGDRRDLSSCQGQRRRVAFPHDRPETARRNQHRRLPRR